MVNLKFYLLPMLTQLWIDCGRGIWGNFLEFGIFFKFLWFLFSWSAVLEFYGGDDWNLPSSKLHSLTKILWRLKTVPHPYPDSPSRKAMCLFGRQGHCLWRTWGGRWTVAGTQRQWWVRNLSSVMSAKAEMAQTWNASCSLSCPSINRTIA